MKTDLVLYLFEGCGYCETVRAAIRELGLEVEERDIHRSAEHYEALVSARGRQTVPVLRIAGTGGEDRWMGESRDIVRYLYAEYGDGEKPPFSIGPYLKIAMWGLLLGGGVSQEPTRSVLWTAACALASARSVYVGVRTRQWVHWAVAGAFAFGALSIALSALRIADLPWWWAAFAVGGAVLGQSLFRRSDDPSPG